MPYTHPRIRAATVLETHLEHPRWQFVASLVLTLFGADWYLSAALSRLETVSTAEHEVRIHMQAQLDTINQNCKH